MQKKSIIIDEKAHAELGKLSESLRMNFGTLIQEMIYYFKKTGIDPKDAVNKNPALMVSALDKRIVSFLKVQERDILKPLRQDVFNYQQAQKEDISKIVNGLNIVIKQHAERTSKITNAYSDHMSRIQTMDTARTKQINEELEKSRKAILVLCQLMDEKNKSGAIDKIKSIFS